MTGGDIRVFNDKNLRTLINIKVEEEFAKCKRDMDEIKAVLKKLEARQRRMNKTLDFVRALPAYKDYMKRR